MWAINNPRRRTQKKQSLFGIRNRRIQRPSTVSTVCEPTNPAEEKTMIRAVENNAHSAGNGHGETAAGRKVRVRILRQDVAGGESYWERFEISH